MTDVLPAGYSIGAMRADEIPTLWGWVEAEGWNPGLHDIAAAFAVKGWGYGEEADFAARIISMAAGQRLALNPGQYGFLTRKEAGDILAALEEVTR